MREVAEAKTVVRRGKQAGGIFGELGGGMRIVLADVASDALARGRELIGVIGAGLTEAETMAAGDCVAPPMAAAKAPLTTDGAAPSRLPTPAAHGSGDGMQSTAPCRPGNEASARHGEMQAAPMSGAPIGSPDETVCGIGGEANDRRCEVATGDDGPAGILTEAGAGGAGPLIAQANAERGLAVGNTEPLIVAVDAALPTAAGDPEPPVAAPQETADPPSAALERDLAALVATRGLLASRWIGRGWEISGRDEQRPPKDDWATWLVMGGRGAGKTRAGAEWVHGLALSAGPRTD